VTCSDFAQCRAYRFSFDSEQSLYIDHDGQRVLADVEGAGLFVASKLPHPSRLWVDGKENTECSRRFLESLIITSPAQGLSEISVLRCSRGVLDAFPRYPIASEEPVLADSVQGCGWIVRSDAIELVDGISDGWSDNGWSDNGWSDNGWSETVQQQPVPVFISARGQGLTFCPAPFRCEQLGEIRMDNPESLKTHSWSVKNASKIFSLESELPGCGTLKSGLLSHLNRGKFSFVKPSGSEGVLIRKLYDAFHGRQRARVMVDGKFRGWWFEPVEDRVSRWRWGHFGFAADPPESEVAIEIDPAAGTPLWSVARYEIHALFPAPTLPP
jgi:hypothetical protein